MSSKMDILRILMDSGLVVKIVLLSLICCSIASWTIIFKKKKVLSQVQLENAEFLEIFNRSTSSSEMLSKAQEYSASSMALMFRSGHEEISKITERLNAQDAKNLREYFESQGIVSLERALKKGSLEASLSLEALLSTLASIASVAPFIGLFGTVWGIIDSFTGLSSGGSSLEAVAPGIAEALVATAVGLFAAIPAVWFYNHFNNQIGRIQSQMESFGQDYLNFVERSVMTKK
ncbi:MAG: MotA/TolQ/ExbB proton channel family protein [Bacteriovoracaceae bacterium]